MNIFKVNKIINRLNKMIDNAMEGRPIENGFDETRLSALETKLSHYLAMNSAAKAQLTEEKARINELISDISHQTKTPIANILLYSQILQESQLAPTEQGYVHSLVEQAEKLNFLISSLVKISRLETGIISVLPTLVPIQPLLNDVLAQAFPKALLKDIKVTCQETDIKAMFDPKWTAEALYNIMDNAIKYTPCGGAICIRVTSYELFVRIDIEDTGIGISEEDVAMIFGRFYRSKEVSDQDGVGIGLYLAREIIGAQGGYIKVRSHIDAGSTFSVFLPLES